MPVQIVLDFMPNVITPVTVTIDFDIKEDDLTEIESRLDNIEPLLNRIARIMRRAAAARFRDGGPGWRPLAESTVAEKLAADLPPKMGNGRIFPRLRQEGKSAAPATTILIRSGMLRDSWVQKRHKYHYESIDPETGTVEIGSELPYAAAHQMGTPPRLITPVQALALRFMNASGDYVFRKYVNHPGLPPRPVQLLPQDEERIREEINRYLNVDRPVADTVADLQ
jgi:phage gpG-like protein